VCSYEIKGLDELDGKGNLEVNYKQGVYKCWACSETHDTHGRLHYLIKKYGTPRQYKKFDLLMPETPGEIEKKHYKRVRLPQEYVSFKDASTGLKMTPIYKTAYNYLKQRNVTDEMIEKYQIGFCHQGKYANRIIIPSFDKDEILNYFVARSYETRPYKKYDNPEAEKQIIIFNESLINWNEPIYIVEGPFDSIFVPNSIPMLGKKMSDFLFGTLYEKAKKIIIVLDGDAYKDAEKLYHRLNGGRLFNKIWITKLPIDKDIADLQGDLTEYPPYQFN
jgi:DNA primase